MNEENVISESDMTLLERTLEEVHSEHQEETPVQEEIKEIPTNSQTLEIDEYTSRFSGATWYNEVQNKSIIIGGCGGISSNTVFQIARMKPARLVIYDDDIVDLSNISGQLFSTEDIGKAKVDAISNMVGKYANYYTANSIKAKYTRNSNVSNIMICGFDNMLARSDFFFNWREYVKSLKEEDRCNCLFIDGRLSFDTLQVFTITGDDDYNINKYKTKFLFSDREADETICSLKQTTYMACMIASFITNNLVNFCANIVAGFPINSLPFFIEYNSNTHYLKTEL